MRAAVLRDGRMVCRDGVADKASPFDTTTPAVVFEAVGVPGIVDNAIRRAPSGTRVVVAGVSIQFVWGYDPKEFAESLRAIADGEIGVAPLITGEVGLNEVGAAFDELAGPGAHCKILVTP